MDSVAFQLGQYDCSSPSTKVLHAKCNCVSETLPSHFAVTGLLRVTKSATVVPSMSACPQTLIAIPVQECLSKR